MDHMYRIVRIVGTDPGIYGMIPGTQISRINVKGNRAGIPRLHGAIIDSQDGKPLFGGIGLALLIVLAMRDTLDVNVIRDRNPLYVTLSDGSIRNGYEIKILNMRGENVNSG